MILLPFVTRIALQLRLVRKAKDSDSTVWKNQKFTVTEIFFRQFDEFFESIKNCFPIFKHEYLRSRAYICLSLSLTSSSPVISQLMQFLLILFSSTYFSSYFYLFLLISTYIFLLITAYF